MRKRTIKLGSCAIFFLLGVVGASFVLRAILRPKADLAVRIAGGSMAPALAGDRFEVTCDDCSFPFSFGVESPPDRDLATCPNCGFQENDVAGLQLVRGQQVRIDRTEWRAADPRRWDVVAVRRNEKPKRLAVKRVVALPGERVAIRGGEIYVDGRMLRKPLDVFRRMAVLVHDHNRRSVELGELSQRWLPQEENDRINTVIVELPQTPNSAPGAPDQGMTLRIAPADHSLSGSLTFLLTKQLHDGATPSPAWLVYHHLPGLPPPSPPLEAAPVWDHLGYNQAASRTLNEVHDLMLRFQVSFSVPGVLSVRFDDGRRRWEVHVSAGPAADDVKAKRTGRLTLRRDDLEVWGSTAPAVDWTRSRRVEFAHVDGQVFLAIDDRMVLKYVDENAAQDASEARQVTKPFAIGVAAGGAEVSQMYIYRDLYYLHPWGNNAAWEMDGRLADDEIFVLGDNSAASIDSRNWTQHGVRVRDVLGYVRPLTGEE